MCRSYVFEVGGNRVTGLALPGVAEAGRVSRIGGPPRAPVCRAPCSEVAGDTMLLAVDTLAVAVVAGRRRTPLLLLLLASCVRDRDASEGSMRVLRCVDGDRSAAVSTK